MARAPWDRYPTGSFQGDLLRMGACFDPITALTAVSTVVSVAGALSGAKAQSNADKYNAAVARNNATIANDQAQAQLRQQQLDAYRKLGSVKASYGASGVTPDGSPEDVLADSLMQAELDANTIVYNGKLKAAGYTNSANLSESSAKNATKAGYVNAASSALLGATKTYQAYDSVGTED